MMIKVINAKNDAKNKTRKILFCPTHAPRIAINWKSPDPNVFFLYISQVRLYTNNMNPNPVIKPKSGNI